MAFNAVNKMPDVYIDEIQLPGPITGVGTATPAFIGPAKGGPPNKPVQITSWTQFLNKFGPDLSDLDPTDDRRVDPNRGYFTEAVVYVTHAVRGFFDNGGAACYFVRTSKAAQASLPLLDTKNATALIVSAKKEGAQGNDIKVAVAGSSIANALEPVKTSAGVKSIDNTKTQIELDAAAQPVPFQAGDTVAVEETINNNPVSEIGVVASTANTTVTLKSPLTQAFTTNATIRIANLTPNLTKARLKDVTGVESGTYLHISQTIQNNTVEEVVVVDSVNPTIKQIVLAGSGFTKTYDLAANEPVTIQSKEFTLAVSHQKNGVPTTDTYEKLSMDPRHSRYFRAVIASASPESVVDVTRGSGTTPAPDNLPADIAAPGTNLAGGQNENISALTDNDFKVSLATLEAVDDVNMICIPDKVTSDVQSEMIKHCEVMQDRFAILDPQRAAGPSNGIVTQRNLLGSTRGFGALYYPRIYISNPFGGDPLLVPPSGHVAGVYARTDDTKGVHKAPANEQLRGALNLETTLTPAEMGRLNEQSINVLRPIPGAGILVWGARTIAKNTQWRYVNVRRLLLFLEESIQEGTQFAVFEPNNLSLRAQVKRQVTDFLTRAWRDGALFGATPEEAFRVRVDEELNPPDVRALGQLIIEVIVVPTTPAEFIVFRIISDPTGNVLLEQ